MTDASLPATGSFRNEPRRSFSREYKRQVVETVLASPSSLARVARGHDLNHNQLSRWRREYQRGLYDSPNASTASQIWSIRIIEWLHLATQHIAARGSVAIESRRLNRHVQA